MSLSCRLHKSEKRLALQPLERCPRTCVRLRRLGGPERGLSPVLHQSIRPFFTSRGIATALLSCPSQSDSRVLAHNERVVGNGCHTASSTRTSLGVPALQGFSPSILHVHAKLLLCNAFWLSPPRATPLSPGAGFRRCSLLMLGPFLAVGACALACSHLRTCVLGCRPGLASQGLDRWAS